MTCVCGQPSFDGTNHPCCAVEGPNCEPCFVSRYWRKHGRAPRIRGSK